MSTTASSPQAGGGNLRPLGVGETIDAAIKLYRNNAAALWTIVAVVIVPLYILQVIVRRATLPSGVFVHNGALYTTSTTGSSSAGGTVALLLVSFLGLLAELLATGAVFKLLLDAYLDRPVDWRESFGFARGRVLSLLWLGILIALLVTVGFILIVAPGIWLIVASSVAVPVLMLEGIKGFKALQRSISLVSGRWWATLGRLLAALLLYIVLAIILGVIVGALTRGLSVSNVTVWLIISGALSAVVSILLSPFIAAVITTVYIDLRVRKEALDLELLASGMARPSAAPAAAATSPTTPATSPTAPAEPPSRQQSVPPPPPPTDPAGPPTG